MKILNTIALVVVSIFILIKPDLFSQTPDNIKNDLPSNIPPGIPGDQLKNFLNESGKHLITNDNKKANEPLTPDSFQEYKFSGAAAGDYFGISVSSAGDVNADGFDDIIVGAYLNSAGGVNAGRVYIYFGSAVMNYTADIVLTGSAGENLGYSVSSAGDVNRDGYDDVVVGAIGYGSYTGRAYIFFGGAAMNNTADVIITGESNNNQFGCSVACAGDVNEDGYSDVLVGARYYLANQGKAYIYNGGPVMDNIADINFYIGNTFGNFASSVACAGDVNGDNISDIIIGEFGFNGTAGAAYIYFGGMNMDNIADVALYGVPYENFGYSVGTAGDMNGDGYDDAIVGGLNYSTANGAAYIFFGGASMNSVADVSIYGIHASDYLGFSVSSAGDINGDGFDDVMVGITGDDAGGNGAGSVNIYYGGLSVNTVADIGFTGNGSEQFGYCTALLGDINGDGYSDIIVGAPNNSQVGLNAGKAYVYTNTRNTVSTPLNSFTGLYGGDRFGITSSDAGDVNGDGYPDVIVGAPSGSYAMLYFGGKLMDNNYDLFFTNTGPFEYFGVSVSTAGDVNNDGYDDIIIGASVYNNNTGRVYLYYGGANMDNVADIVFTGQAANNYFGHCVSNAGDVNNDNFDDIVISAYSAAKAYVFFGGAVMNNVSDVNIVDTAGSNYGYSLSNAGDVNNDNYDDIIIGAFGANYGIGKADIFFGGAAMDNIVDVTFIGLGFNSRLGSAVSYAGDINNDSYSDVIISGRVADPFNNDSRGMIQVFYGGASMNNIPDITGIGIDLYYLLGAAVSDAGDFNKDGYFDFAATSAQGKRVYIYFGGPDADNVPDVTISGERANFNIYLGMSVSNAGDVNGDGYVDIISGGYYDFVTISNAFIFSYSQTGTDITDNKLTGASAGDLFGYSVSTAGDINADGFSDFIIGARYADNSAGSTGRAYLYYGGSPMDYVPDLTFFGQANGDQFGYSVACAGDVNSDNYPDLIIGAPTNDAGGTDAGRAYLYYGGPGMDNTADVTMTGFAAGDQFGFCVSSAGNINGNYFTDVWDDVIIGAPYNDGGGTSCGRVYVYLGSNVMDNVVDAYYNGEFAGDFFGVSIAIAGDVNYDSYGDIIVGATGFDYNISTLDVGKAYIFYGAALLNTSPALTLTNNIAGENFGISVAGAGNVNGDFTSDVIVGAYGNDNAGTDAGKAYIYFGDNPMNSVVDIVLTGESQYDLFGISVASAGDVNADGIGDVIVGSLNAEVGPVQAGKAYIYFGGLNMINTPEITYPGTATENYAISVANAGDVNGDGKSDHLVGAFLNSTAGTYAGRAYLFLSSEPVERCILTSKIITQAFYELASEKMSSSDTFKVVLRNPNFPYSIIDQSNAFINKVNFTGKFYFRNAPSGNYYLQIKHRNSLETWSTSPVTLTRNVNTNYDFTDAITKAYGSNMIQVDNSPLRFAIYGGDENQDGTVDIADVLDIYNDANNIVTGYVPTDADGNYVVDATDMLIAFNNSNNIVTAVTP